MFEGRSEATKCARIRELFSRIASEVGMAPHSVGVLAVVGFAATQPVLPRIVPRPLLLTANAGVDRSDAAARTAGPALGCVLVSVMTAPIAIALDAVSCPIDAVLIARVRVVEQAVTGPACARLRRDIADGLRWTYGHAPLAPLAVSTHLRFLANAAALTVFATLALRALALPAAVHGAILAVSGIAMLAGTTVITSFVASAFQGVALGSEDANEMSLRQTITSDELLGRMDTTMRSEDRTLAAAGAVGGGAPMSTVRGAFALLAVAFVFTAAVIVAARSPLQTVDVR
jgi:hypothetical protein